MNDDRDDSGTERAESEIERQFQSMTRTIALAAQEQGPDRDSNIWLRCAIARAERAHIDDWRIDEALERGAGETDDPPLQFATYEGYGPEDVAVIVRSITEDPRRTREELDEIFKEFGGNIGEDGCVAWQFQRRGLVLVREESVEDEDTLTLDVIEMGGDEIGDPLYRDDDERASAFRVYCEADDLLSLAESLDGAGYDIDDIQWIQEATQHVELNSDQARSFLSFNERLTKRVDVQSVFSNWTSA